MVEEADFDRFRNICAVIVPLDRHRGVPPLELGKEVADVNTVPSRQVGLQQHFDLAGGEPPSRMSGVNADKQEWPLAPSPEGKPFPLAAGPGEGISGSLVHQQPAVSQQLVFVGEQVCVLAAAYCSFLSVHSDQEFRRVLGRRLHVIHPGRKRLRAIRQGNFRCRMAVILLRPGLRPSQDLSQHGPTDGDRHVAASRKSEGKQSVPVALVEFLGRVSQVAPGELP